MASSQPIILFDIPTRDGTPWSFNPWKIRLLLNYKGLAQRTEWVEYPDIKPRLEGRVTPHDDIYQYTVPTILLPSGEYMMDSKKIFSFINENHPTPPLPGLEDPYYAKTLSVMRDIVNEAFYGIFVPIVPKNILSQRSQEYWYETRTRDHGCDMDTLWKEKGGQKGWDASEEGFRKATELYKENKGGPFVLGDKVSYADFCWGGFLLFLKALGGEGEGAEGNVWEEFRRKCGDPGVHEELLRALEPWTKI